MINFTTKDKKVFIILNIIGMFYILPLILSNVYYVDDYRRSLGYYYEWEQAGRPLANFFMFLLTDSWQGIDISPMPLLLSLLLLSFCGIIINNRVFKNYEVQKKIIISLPILINPFFLGNLSFRFDCWTMTIAQFMSAIAATTFRKKTISDCIIRISLLTAILSTYQASLNFYISICFLIMIVDLLNGSKFRESLICFIIDFFLMMVSFVIYKLCIIHFINFSSYGESHSSFIHMNKFFFKNIFININIFFHFICQMPRIYFLSIVSLIFISIIFPYNKGPVSKTKSRMIIITGIVFFAFSTPGLCLLLENPVMEYRTLLGFPVLVMFLFYIAINSNVKYLKNLIIFLNLFSATSTCYAYGNVLYAQNLYRENFAGHIFNKLLENGYKKSDKIFLIGREPISPANVFAIKSNPALRNLIPIQLGNSKWGLFVFAKLGAGLTLLGPAEQELAKESIIGMKPVYSDFRFSLYKEKQYYIIDINE
ncbi:glucosyltransferase domain-containing protein [Komagataeibacter xylinus]|uniref:O-antigen conversion protein n=1 Tax=Komagataeibacter xylinus TaxID=28448 RepID=A0A857FKA4_KOMXY|nr:glucosyltransferase domain-containing protein [Komagataeibacter xylinus]QHC34642.1 O-antigen conversion protein [Komagataeibacter xylinus]